MKHQYVATVLALACGVAISACSDPTDSPVLDVALTTDRDSYAIGEPGYLTLDNRGDRSVVVLIGLCNYKIERRSGDVWERLPFSQGVCPLANLILHKGGAETRGFAVDSVRFAPGLYRLRVPFAARSGEQPGDFAATDPFTVE